MHKFDTKVQYLKYQVLREVARHAFDGTLAESIPDIPKTIAPGPEPTMRCCIYKERAILAERIKLAMGGDKTNSNIIETINIACDECPVSGYEVTAACRGCIAHRCEETCPRGAIRFDRAQKAHIDDTKCVECGKCAKVCPYHAIKENRRPCENACAAHAVSMDGEKRALIDNDKCTACGACVYQCPFGAIMDKSFLLDAVDLIKKSEGNEKYKLFAVVAPSISSQFVYAKLGQVVTGLKELGFHTVVEAALGADMTAYKEAKELKEKGFLLSSCCPAFVTYVEKNYPGLKQHVSETLSPMAMIGKYIKSVTPGAKVIFIGPCTAKKTEQQRPSVQPYVDCVLTFEELQALFDSRGIDLTSLSEGVLDNASCYGRIFARSGGLSGAVAEALREQGEDSFALSSTACDGIEECRIALLKKSKGVDVGNFVEGMACFGGCIGGAGCLTHGEKNRAEVDEYGREACEKNIQDALSVCMLPGEGA